MRQGGVVMAFIVGKKQKKAAKLFAEGKKTREVAALVGVHRTTLWRWWQHEESEENVVLMDADGARFQEYLIEAIYELGEKLQ